MGKQKKFMLVAIGLAAVLMGGALLLCFAEGAPLHAVECWLRERVGADLFAYYTSQLSLTFITISVMSVLSEKNVIIYWENIAESRLIKPTFGCFAAFSWYSIIANIGSAAGVFIKSYTVFALFFLANILVLILLTNAIIDVYYGKDSKKKKLVRELQRDLACQIREEDGSDAYVEKILGLQQRVRQLHAESNMLELREIYNLYEAEYPLFDDVSAKPFTEALSDSLDLKTDDLFVRMLSRVTETEEARMRAHFISGKAAMGVPPSELPLEEIVEVLEAQPVIPPEENPFGEEAQRTLMRTNPFYDCEIWMALVHTHALKRWVSQVDIVNTRTPSYMEFARVLKRRLVAVYNYFGYLSCVSKGHPEFVDHILLKQKPSGEVVLQETGESVDPQLLEHLIHIAFAHMERGVWENEPLYVLWKIVRDYYLAGKNTDTVGMFLGEYRDFPIPAFMLNWAWGEEVEMLYELLDRKSDSTDAEQSQTK